MAQVRMENVSKRFKEVIAVEKVNLVIEDREFLVLLGPSGCGKSTTLRMVAGLEELTAGDIFIGDRCVNEVPAKDRDIAMVFQNYALYPHKNVYNNLAFGLKLRKFPKQEIDQRVRKTARTLEIEDLLDRKPRELSGGQRQRVAMGRAIVRQPKVFLFDEPLSNLDAKLRVQMRAELSKLHSRLGTTIIYVTHDQVEAMTLGDRIVIMDRGRIIQMGLPLEVYNHPRNLFVAEFIGSPPMSLLDSRVEADGHELYIVVEGNRLPIPRHLHKRFGKAVDQEVILGLRPEHISEAREDEISPGCPRVRATVEVVEPLGPQVILLASFGSAKLNASVGTQCKTVPGTNMEFGLNLNHMHLFGKESGDAF